MSTDEGGMMRGTLPLIIPPFDFRIFSSLTVRPLCL
jgi:hypothetical protein